MEHATGCLLGVAVGDAAGAPLEGLALLQPVEPELALEAMRMPGSASKPVLGQGQTTDDTELALCLARGLAGHSPSAGFPLESIAQQYSYWHSAGAFGGGMACMTAFSVPLKSDRTTWVGGQPPLLATRMQARSLRYNEESKANGALMRCAPLAVWGHRLAPTTLAEYAALDAGLSHPNPTCADCSAAYVIAVAHLIAHPGDATGALEAACNWAEQHAGEEAQGWLADSSQPLGSCTDCLDSPGFVRHGFVLAFHHLRRQTPFVDSMQQTLCLGGDTDTNAAIVGGMMGALHGADSIPGYMSRPVLEYEGREEQGCGWPRPEDLRAKCLPGLAGELYQLGARSGPG